MPGRVGARRSRARPRGGARAGRWRAAELALERRAAMRAAPLGRGPTRRRGGPP